MEYYEERERQQIFFFFFFCNLEKRNYINKVITELNVTGKTDLNPMPKYCQNKKSTMQTFTAQKLGQ